MSDYKVYAVVLHASEDLESFYDDMETPGGDLYIPDREVELDARFEGSRVTFYNLTEDEASELYDDPRVLSVDANEDLEETPIESDWTIAPGVDGVEFFDRGDGGANGYSGRMLKNSDDTFRGEAWAFRACVPDQSAKVGGPTYTPGSHGGTTGTNPITTTPSGLDINRFNYSTVNVRESGRNVDVVIVDENLKPDDTGQVVFPGGEDPNQSTKHSEFIDGDGPGNTDRINDIDWATLYGELATGKPPSGIYQYTDNDIDHAYHVAGTVAGLKYGWAKRANIYNIQTSGGVEATRGGYNITDMMKILAQFHKSKPINPATGRRNPTVSNHSWTYLAWPYGSRRVGAPRYWNYRIKELYGTSHKRIGSNLKDILRVNYRGVNYEGPFTLSISDREQLAEFGIEESSFVTIALRLTRPTSSTDTEFYAEVVDDGRYSLLSKRPPLTQIQGQRTEAAIAHFLALKRFMQPIQGTYTNPSTTSWTPYPSFSGAYTYTAGGDQPFLLCDDRNGTLTTHVDPQKWVVDCELTGTTIETLYNSNGDAYSEAVQEARFIMRSGDTLGAWGNGLNTGDVVYIRSQTRWIRQTRYYFDSFATAVRDCVDTGVHWVTSAGNNSGYRVQPGTPDWDNYYEVPYRYFAGKDRDPINVSEQDRIWRIYYNREGHQGRWEAGEECSTIMVGAIDNQLRQTSTTNLEKTSSFSDRGPGVDIWAPGSLTLSALHTRATGNFNGNKPLTDYEQTLTGNVRRSRVGLAQGTSMSSPQVAGAIACILEAYPDLTPLEMKKELILESRELIFSPNSASDTSDDVYTRPGGGGVTMSGLTQTNRKQALAGGPNNFLTVRSQRPITGVVSPKRSPLGRKTDQSGVVFPRKQSKFGLRPQ